TVSATRDREAAIPARTARRNGRGRTAYRAAADADLRAVPLLLDLHHLVQDDAANSAVYVDLPAEPVDDRTVPFPPLRHAVPDVVPQYGDRGDDQHGALGEHRGAGGVRAGASQVPRLESADDAA